MLQTAFSVEVDPNFPWAENPCGVTLTYNYDLFQLSVTSTLNSTGKDIQYLLANKISGNINMCKLEGKKMKEKK